jgi:hypothetical protein
MKTERFASCAVAICVVALSAVPVAAATVDTIDATSGQANTYFVPTLGQELDAPYYRDASGDWGWTHNAVVGFTTATLNISAFDVDYTSGERDAIYIGTDNTGIFLGYLTGTDNAFSFASFDVTAYGTQLAAGLQVFMDISCASTCVGGPDQNGTTGWLVSLSKSVLTTDGASPGNPNPGETPLPAALPLFATGLGGLGLLGWRRKKKAQAAA